MLLILRLPCFLSKFARFFKVLSKIFKNAWKDFCKFAYKTFLMANILIVISRKLAWQITRKFRGNSCGNTINSRAEDKTKQIFKRDAGTTII